MSSGDRSASKALARARSSDGRLLGKNTASCNMRSWSSLRISSACGAVPQTASIPARSSSNSARRRRAGRHQQDADALAAGTAGTARTMLHHLRIVRQVGMNDEIEARQVDAARRDVGRNAHPGASVAQGLQAPGCARSGSFHPTSATTEKPRSSSAACKCLTASRVLQNTSALGAS